jgi:hypothetical protein
MRPASSFSYALLTSIVTLIAWLCLGVMMLVFLIWAPFAWLGLKLGSRPSDGSDAADSSSASQVHSLLKQART